jgi:hypothetical protein
MVRPGTQCFRYTVFLLGVQLNRHGDFRVVVATLAVNNRIPAVSPNPIPGSRHRGRYSAFSGSVAGTVVLVINNRGAVSGHSASGAYESIDAPGAYQTSGGGLNNNGVVVGHYVDISCNPTGYIATPMGSQLSRVVHRQSCAPNRERKRPVCE